MDSGGVLKRTLSFPFSQRDGCTANGGRVHHVQVASGIPRLFATATVGRRGRETCLSRSTPKRLLETRSALEGMPSDQAPDVWASVGRTREDAFRTIGSSCVIRPQDSRCWGRCRAESPRHGRLKGLLECGVGSLPHQPHVQRLSSSDVCLGTECRSEGRRLSLVCSDGSAPAFASHAGPHRVRRGIFSSVTSHGRCGFSSRLGCGLLEWLLIRSARTPQHTPSHAYAHS